MIAHTSELNESIERSAPSLSTGGVSGSDDSGTSGFAAISAPATIGRLTRKTEPHEKWSRRRPPATGPIAIPIPDTPAQIEIAFARSRLGNTFVRTERVDGMMNAAPRPITPRPAINIVDEVAIVATSEPAPKTPRPASSAFLRPKRSPSVPAVRRRPAKINRYESLIHCNCEDDAFRSSWMLGSATLRIVLSRLITTSDRQRTPSVHQRRR